MSNKTASGRIIKRQKQNKLPTLPPTAQVTKRPLLRPGIPSPYAGTSQQKVVYISAKTPFLSAVKRAEKLLHLSDKRVVQSATHLSKRNRRRGDDEIVGIAKEVEKQKKGVEKKEEVVLKGTGKAIAKVMELALWFQQRGEEYEIRLKTGSVGAVEDVEYEEESMTAGVGAEENEEMVMVENNSEKTVAKPMSKVVRREERESEDGKTEISETRIRQLSVLEVYVSLR